MTGTIAIFGYGPVGRRRKCDGLRYGIFANSIHREVHSKLNPERIAAPLVIAAQPSAERLNQTHPHMTGLGGVKTVRKTHAVVLIGHRKTLLAELARKSDPGRQACRMGIFQRV